MGESAEDITRERALAIKGLIRLLADHAERPVDERRHLAEFTVELVDRLLAGNGDAPAGPQTRSHRATAAAANRIERTTRTTR